MSTATIYHLDGWSLQQSLAKGAIALVDGLAVQKRKKNNS